jgi:hypothetical protein
VSGGSALLWPLVVAVAVERRAGAVAVAVAVLVLAVAVLVVVLAVAVAVVVVMVEVPQASGRRGLLVIHANAHVACHVCTDTASSCSRHVFNRCSRSSEACSRPDTGSPAVI